MQSGPTSLFSYSDMNFDAGDYLREYYRDVGSENRAILHFIVASLARLPPGRALLDYGCGPALYVALAAAEKYEEIHVCDYLTENLAEIKKWVSKTADAFDWRAFTQYIVETERGAPCSEGDVLLREEKTRNRIKAVSRCDVTKRSFDGQCSSWPQFDVVVCQFCLEAVARSFDEWLVYARNVASYLKPRGTFILGTIEDAEAYGVGSREYPTLRLSRADVLAGLDALGVVRESVCVESVPADGVTRKYNGLILARGVLPQLA